MIVFSDQSFKRLLLKGNSLLFCALLIEFSVEKKSDNAIL